MHIFDVLVLFGVRFYPPLLNLYFHHKLTGGLIPSAHGLSHNCILLLETLRGNTDLCAGSSEVETQSLIELDPFTFRFPPEPENI